MADIQAIANDLSSLTVMQVAELVKLLEGDRATIALLARDPFPGGPPQVVRAQLWLYRFTTPAERRQTGAWWRRSYVRPYVPPVSLP